MQQGRSIPDAGLTSQAGHGARLMPAGTIKGLKVIQTSKWVSFVGNIDLKKVDINGYKDGGGELDPFGATNQGNPVGGLVYSSFFGGSASNPRQVDVWHTFLEDSDFCFRMCNPDLSHDDQIKYCPHARRPGLACAHPRRSTTSRAVASTTRRPTT